MKALADCLILLVDDVRTNINILVEALKGDYRLGFALDGESALKFAVAKHPDLILLDIMMPGMDGYEVCRRLKADPVTRDIPVLFITAMDEIKSKTVGFELGAQDYITKPFEVLEVKARVKTHLTLKLARQVLERQRDRMKQALDLAMEVQQSLLPKKAPVVEGLDIAGRSIYCDETGGDYYDYLNTNPSGPDTIRLVVGDVSGHGIQSALLMTTARAFLRQRSSLPGDVASVVSDVNQNLVRDIERSGHFMTLFLCEIEPGAGVMNWVRAGHDPALIYDSRSGEFHELAGSGMALGISADSKYESSRIEIKPGQVILIGTDGIWETHNSRRDLFGKDRLKDIIRGQASRPADEIVAAVIREVEEFRHPLEKEDDITLVVARVVG